jgi:hypothetical protein
MTGHLIFYNLTIFLQSCDQMASVCVSSYHTVSYAVKMIWMLKVKQQFIHVPVLVLSWAVISIHNQMFAILWQHFNEYEYAASCPFHHFLGLQWLHPTWRPPLWSSGQSSWLQMQRSWFYFRRYQIFREVVGLEQGPLSLVSTIEELLGRKSSSSGLESREYCHRDPSRWPRGTLYPQKLTLTSPTGGSRPVIIVRSRSGHRI